MADFNVSITYCRHFNDYHLFKYKCLRCLQNKRQTDNVILFALFDCNSLVAKFAEEENMKYVAINTIEAVNTVEALIAFNDGKDIEVQKQIDTAKENGVLVRDITIPAKLSFTETLDSDKGITKLIYFHTELFNEPYLTLHKNNGVAFNSKCPNLETRILSNHAYCDLLVNGIHFNSVEQLYFVLRFFDYPDIQRELLRYNPTDSKRIGSKYANDIYEVHYQKEGLKANLLMYCHRIKMKQCKTFREYINGKVRRFEHKGRQFEWIPNLIEYCSDWSDYKNGMVDVDKSNRNNWEDGLITGQNRCGRMMRRVFREYLKGLLDAPIPPPYPYLKILGKPVEKV